jgi:hypothetical protein
MLHLYSAVLLAVVFGRSDCLAWKARSLVRCREFPELGSSSLTRDVHVITLHNSARECFRRQSPLQLLGTPFFAAPQLTKACSNH